MSQTTTMSEHGLVTSGDLQHGISNNPLHSSPAAGQRDPSKRWAVLFETGPETDSGTARAGGTKSWQQWGRGWRHLVAETFNNNNSSNNDKANNKRSKHPAQTLDPGPCSPPREIPRGDGAGRRPSLTRSNAIHKRKSRYSSSSSGTPTQADELLYDRDPVSQTPSMTSGESTLDTPLDSPLVGGSGDRTGPASSATAEKAQRLDAEALFPHIHHDENEPFAQATEAPENVALWTSGAVSAVLSEERSSDGESAAPKYSVEELQGKIRALEAELRVKNDDLARKEDVVHGILAKLRPADHVSHRRSADPLTEAAIIASRMNHTNALLGTLENALTPRNILMMKYIQRQGDSVPPTKPKKRSGTTGEASESGDFAYLDQPLDITYAAEFATRLDTRPTLGSSGTLTVKLCRACCIPKFLNAPLPAGASTSSCLPTQDSSTGLTELNEFFSRTGVTTCCSKALCKECFVSGLVAGLSADLWNDLGSRRLGDDNLDWLRCPMPLCSQPIAQPQQQQHGFHATFTSRIAARLFSLGGAQLASHLDRFVRAVRLRSALEAISPRPTGEALARAGKLHQELARQGRMLGLFNPDIDVDDLVVQVLPVDSDDGSRSLMVPIFTGLFIVPTKPIVGLPFLNQSNHGVQTASGAMIDIDGAPNDPPIRTFIDNMRRECSICCDAVRDLTDGTPEDEARWRSAVKSFPGTWSVSVRGFPSAALLPTCASRHALDICHNCLTRHLSSQLDSRGRDAAGKLTCPVPGCGHIYSHEEVRLLLLPSTASTGGGDVFARYDRLCLLQHLSSVEGFMWCLREGCENGQIYDIALDDDSEGWAAEARRKVECDSCGFSMCIRHQTAWHEGLSCREWDEFQDEGAADPSEAASRTWVASNTKRCPGPGCGVPVQKGEGCFHMTCRRCGFEWCWECLADWSNIVPSRRGSNVLGGASGHNVGCVFREPGAPRPTAIRGTSAREAIRGDR